MKMINKYVCEFCQKEYETSLLAKMCEEQHVKPEKITAHIYEMPAEFGDKYDYYGCKYPKWLKIKMADGSTKIYHAFSNE